MPKYSTVQTQHRGEKAGLGTTAQAAIAISHSKV